ncbi:MAG: nucleoporin protein Ndc1-Nup [Podila humilis]|nr:MAG: nucleoporin protein Ndc1-Nup [Podila humilis]
MSSQIARTKRAQPLHSLTYRLCSRKVLHSRCFTSLGLVAGLSYVAALASQLWSFYVYGHLFSWHTCVLTFTFFVAGAGLVGARNALVSVNPRISPTLLHAVVSIASDLSTWGLVLYYVVANIVLETVLFRPAEGLGRDYTHLTTFISEKGISQVNERVIIMIVFGYHLGLAHGLLHLLQQRDWISFPAVHLSTVAHVRSNLVHIGKKSALFASIFTVLFWFGYNIFLSPILIRMAMKFIAKDVLYHSSQHGPRWWSIDLAFRLFWNTFITTALLESVHAICDQFLSKTMEVTNTSVDPNACLISGLNVEGSNASPESILTYHAFQELHQLAGYSPSRRADIFNDVICVPSTWKQISTKCLQVMNKGAARIESLNPKAPGAPAENVNGLTRRKLAPGKGGAVETDIFNTAKPLKESTSFVQQTLDGVQDMLDSLKGASTEELLAQQRLAEEVAAGKKVDPTLRPVTGPRKRPEVLAFRWLAKTISDFVATRPWLQKQLSSSGPRPNPAVLPVMDDYQLVIWSFQSMARMVNASFREDKMGVVQNDIPAILESMVGLLTSLEKFVGSAQFQTAVSSSESAHAFVGVRSVAMVQALKTSIYQIVHTFKNHLGDFVLAPVTVERLRQFVDLDD